MEEGEDIQYRRTWPGILASSWSKRREWHRTLPWYHQRCSYPLESISSHYTRHTSFRGSRRDFGSILLQHIQHIVHNHDHCVVSRKSRWVHVWVLVVLVEIHIDKVTQTNQTQNNTHKMSPTELETQSSYWPSRKIHVPWSKWKQRAYKQELWWNPSTWCSRCERRRIKESSTLSLSTCKRYILIGLHNDIIGFHIQQCNNQILPPGGLLRTSSTHKHGHTFSFHPFFTTFGIHKKINRK